MSYTKRIKFSVTGTYGNHPENEEDVYTVAEFLDCVACAAFIDDDGYGHPIKNGLADEGIDIYPSDAAETIPADATHIVWFNR